MTVIIIHIGQISKQSEIIVFIYVFKLISNLTNIMMIAKSLLLNIFKIFHIRHKALKCLARNTIDSYEDCYSKQIFSKYFRS